MNNYRKKTNPKITILEMLLYKTQLEIKKNLKSLNVSTLLQSHVHMFTCEHGFVIN